MTQDDITWAKKAARAFMRTCPVQASNAPAVENAAMFAIWHARETFDAEKGMSLRSYIFANIPHKIMDEMRKWNFWGRSRRQHPFNLDDVAPILAWPDENMEAGRASLHELLARLSPREHEVIKRYYFECKNDPEIAEEQGVCESRITQIRHRALEKMRRYGNG